MFGLMPVQAFYLASILVILPLAWLKGGHAERRGVVLLIVGYVASTFVVAAILDRVRIGELVVDLVLLVFLIALMLRSNRWWPMVAVAVQLLTVASYAAVWLDPDQRLRDNVAARWVLGMVVLYSLLGGVAERWLAGERPAMPPLRSRRSVTGCP